MPGWNIVSANGGHLPSLRNLFGRSDTQRYRAKHISLNVWGDCDVHLGLASDAAQLSQDITVREVVQLGWAHLLPKVKSHLHLAQKLGQATVDNLRLDH